jgi:hypothetical protein
MLHRMSQMWKLKKPTSGNGVEAQSRQIESKIIELKRTRDRNKQRKTISYAWLFGSEKERNSRPWNWFGGKGDEVVLASNLKVLSLLAFFSSIHNHNLTGTDTHPPVVLFHQYIFIW